MSGEMTDPLFKQPEAAPVSQPVGYPQEQQPYQPVAQAVASSGYATTTTVVQQQTTSMQIRSLAADGQTFVFVQPKICCFSQCTDVRLIVDAQAGDIQYEVLRSICGGASCTRGVVSKTALHNVTNVDVGFSQTCCKVVAVVLAWIMTFLFLLGGVLCLVYMSSCYHSSYGRYYYSNYHCYTNGGLVVTGSIFLCLLPFVALYAAYQSALCCMAHLHNTRVHLHNSLYYDILLEPADAHSLLQITAATKRGLHSTQLGAKDSTMRTDAILAVGQPNPNPIYAQRVALGRGI